MMIQDERVAAMQRMAQQARGGRPSRATREDALGLCTACGWSIRGAERAVTDRDNPGLEQMRLWDATSTHAFGAHALTRDLVRVATCDEVRERLGVPEPPYYPQPYLRCITRFYVVQPGAEGMRDAYHIHWDRCTATEALRRVSNADQSEGTEVVYTHGDPLLPGWVHVP